MNQSKSKKISRRQVIATSLGAAGIAVVGATGALAESRPSRLLKGKRVLISIGEFSEGLETYYMIYRLMEEGAVPVVAASKAKRLQMVVHDFDPQYSNYTEKLGYQIESQVAYKDVSPAEYDGLLIPGGRGPEEIRQYDDVLKIVGYFMDKKLPLGAMCHGPQVIYAARPIKGRRLAAYHGIRADVELAGGVFVDEPAVVDGSLVTSRGWPDLPYFMPKFLKVLAGK
jgi:protease I